LPQISRSRRAKNYCFACGPDNQEGLRLVFKYDADAVSASCVLKLPAKYQGATGYAHGGMIATLLDEAMAKTNGLGGIRAVTVRLQVNYRKLVPVEKEIRLRGWRTSKRGRKLFLRAEIRDPQGLILADARGLFLSVQHA
jgi:acyl-coenzyme A thioesterase PaaI-like protein